MSLAEPPEDGRFFRDHDRIEELFSEPGNRYRIFREKVVPVLREHRGNLAKLYCEDNGRPGIEPVVLAGVTLLQFMEKVPDRRAVDLVKYHLGWKYALDVSMVEETFHPTSLVTFRDRLVSGGAERVLFDAVLKLLEDEGMVKKRGKVRIDSTHVLASVREMSRGERMRDTIRMFLDEVQGRGVEGTLSLWEEMKQRYLDWGPDDWGKKTKDELRVRFETAARDALELIKWARQQRIWDSEKTLLLERVFLEQCELATGVVIRPKESSGTMQNPHDPQAQWATKDLAKMKAWVGYKVQVIETVPDTPPKEDREPTEAFITEITTTAAITSDLAGMEQAMGQHKAHVDPQPSAVYSDGAYVSAEMLAKAKDEGWELIGRVKSSPEHKQGFKTELFDVHNEERIAICPAGNTSTQSSLIHDAHHGSSYYRYEWGNQCDRCELRERCTNSKNARRTLCVGIHHDLLQARRREMDTPAFQEKLRSRIAIEGTISEVSRQGLRRSRYRGLCKTSLANYCLGAAVNVNRYLRRTIWRIAQSQKAA